ncbi:MAG: DUF1566 domain-containing protein [Candidatus Lernaella stagnicola]|nr:DUF1566 domain-containing protein [Candidatus Lernaella stagnicola]
MKPPISNRLGRVALFVVLVLLLPPFACGDDDDDNSETGDDDTHTTPIDDDNDTNSVADDDDDDTFSDDDNDNDTTDDDDNDDSTPVECGTVIRGDLEWTQCDNGEDINHYVAQTWAQNLHFDGKNDWRLPTKWELAALYDESRTIESGCYIPVHIAEPFYLSCSHVWVADVASWWDEMSWTVGFSKGDLTIMHREAEDRIRALAVRDLN